MKILPLIVIATLCGLFTTAAIAADSKGPVNITFDNADSVKDLRFEFGGAEHTEKFSPDDGAGKKDSGSLEVTLNFPAKDGEHKGAYTFTLPESVDGRRFKALDFDVKVVEGSAPDSQGDNGYLTIAFRDENNGWEEQFGDTIRVSDNWRHESASLTSDTKELKGISFQLWGGPEQNINGTVTLRLDNIRLVPKEATPPKGSADSKAK